jgi:hypothetical protein
LPKNYIMVQIVSLKLKNRCSTPFWIPTGEIYAHVSIYPFSAKKEITPRSLYCFLKIPRYPSHIKEINIQLTTTNTNSGKPV